MPEPIYGRGELLSIICGESKSGTVTEPERLALRQWAGEHLDELAAEGFMKSLPPKGWDDLATKSDLKTLRAATKAGIAALDAKLDTKAEALETKIDTLGTVLTATFTAALATEMGKVHQEFAAVHKEIGAIRGGQRGQMLTLIVMIFVAMIGQTTVSRYFPPAPPQIIIQSPSE